MTIGPGGAGTKVIRRDYPVEEGLTAETTKQEGTQAHLIPEEDLCPEEHWGGI